jgi:hypothetical protein
MTARNSLPDTVGELRRILAELGNPWSVDPRLGDDDPLPDYPRGGQIVRELPGTTISTDKFISFLKKLPPSNPFLRAHWVEMGLLDEDSPGTSYGSSPHVSSDRKTSSSPPTETV